MNDASRLLETERLILRCPTADDGAAVNLAIRESWTELSVWMAWAQGEPPLAEETSERLGSRAAGFADRSDFSYAAFERETERFLGMFSLFRLDWDVPKGEIGYWIRTEATGNGFATEATQALVKLGLETLKLARIEIRCDTRNIRSRAVAERVGFALDGVLKNECRDPFGELRDTCVYTKLP